jgi:hypothetical protein
MKIIYTQNPLRTQIELDAHEKKELWYKIKIDKFEDLLMSTHISLEKGDFFDLERAREATDPKDWCTDEIDKRVDTTLAHFINALVDMHDGDCTCVPGSCLKCHAEDFVGVNTLPGLGKHEAYKIKAAFYNKAGTQESTLEEAIMKMELPYNPTKGVGWESCSDEAFQSHMPRWKAEHEGALEWLKKYRDQHFSG